MDGLGTGALADFKVGLRIMGTCKVTVEGIKGGTAPNVTNRTVRPRCGNLSPWGRRWQYPSATPNTVLLGGSKIVANVPPRTAGPESAPDLVHTPAGLPYKPAFTERRTYAVKRSHV
jgi:hypothetical protein